MVLGEEPDEDRDEEEAGERMRLDEFEGLVGAEDEDDALDDAELVGDSGEDDVVLVVVLVDVPEEKGVLVDEEVDQEEEKVVYEEGEDDVRGDMQDCRWRCRQCARPLQPIRATRSPFARVYSWVFLNHE